MKKEINFVGNVKKYLCVPLVIVILGVVCNIIFGTQLDISFKGGTLLKYTYVGELDEQAVSDFVNEQLGIQAEVKLSDNDLVADSSLLTITSTEDISLEQSTALDEALTAQYPDQQVELSTSNSLKPSMGRLFFTKCLVAILLASIFLVVYVALRFRKIGGWTAGVMAVLALLNDVLVAYFAFVVFRIPLNDNFVAVVLSILGYSLNDTIVVYDRIRENRRIMDSKCSIAEVVNRSINQSFTRTLNTSICTFIAIATVAVVGLIFRLDSIISFAVPMMFGVISGFYTSVFLCSPLWARWQQHILDKNAAAKNQKKGSKKAPQAKKA